MFFPSTGYKKSEYSVPRPGEANDLHMRWHPHTSQQDRQMPNSAFQKPRHTCRKSPKLSPYVLEQFPHHFYCQHSNLVITYAYYFHNEKNSGSIYTSRLNPTGMRRKPGIPLHVQCSPGSSLMNDRSSSG